MQRFSILSRRLTSKYSYSNKHVHLSRLCSGIGGVDDSDTSTKREEGFAFEDKSGGRAFWSSVDDSEEINGHSPPSLSARQSIFEDMLVDDQINESNYSGNIGDSSAEPWIEKTSIAKARSERLKQDEANALAQGFTEKADMIRYSRQLDEEANAISDAKDEYEQLRIEMSKLGNNISLKPEKKLLISWYVPLKAAIESYQAKTRMAMKSKVAKKVPYAADQYLLQVDAGRLAVIVMHDVLGTACASGVTATSVALKVGKTINEEINIQKLKRNAEAWAKLKWEVRNELEKAMSPSSQKSKLRPLDVQLAVHQAVKIQKQLVDKHEEIDVDKKSNLDYTESTSYEKDTISYESYDNGTESNEKDTISYESYDGTESNIINEFAEDWGTRLKASVGANMIKLLIDSCTIPIKNRSSTLKENENVDDSQVFDPTDINGMNQSETPNPNSNDNTLHSESNPDNSSRVSAFQYSVERTNGDKKLTGIIKPHVRFQN